MIPTHVKWLFRLAAIAAIIAAGLILFTGKIPSPTTDSYSSFEGIERLMFIIPLFLAYVFYLVSNIEDDNK